MSAIRTGCHTHASPWSPTSLMETIGLREFPKAPHTQVLSLERHVQGWLRHQQRNRLYTESNMTSTALDQLYERPAFQSWYAANRAELLDEVHLRQQGVLWRRLTKLAILLVGLCVLPAFSFSNQARITGWSGVPNGVPPSAATMSQLILTQMGYVRHERSIAVWGCRASEQTSQLCNTVLSQAETLVVLVAVCTLLTSVFMPRRTRYTATASLISFLVLLAECASVTGVKVQPGLGFIVILGFVASAVVRAA